MKRGWERGRETEKNPTTDAVIQTTKVASCGELVPTLRVTAPLFR